MADTAAAAEAPERKRTFRKFSYRCVDTTTGGASRGGAPALKDRPPAN